MARKSRKNLQTAEAIVLPEISESLDKKMATAAYARLSVEKEQDESIHAAQLYCRASGHETDGYLY